MSIGSFHNVCNRKTKAEKDAEEKAIMAMTKEKIADKSVDSFSCYTSFVSQTHTYSGGR